MTTVRNNFLQTAPSMSRTSLFMKVSRPQQGPSLQFVGSRRSTLLVPSLIRPVKLTRPMFGRPIRLISMVLPLLVPTPRNLRRLRTLIAVTLFRWITCPLLPWITIPCNLLTLPTCALASARHRWPQLVMPLPFNIQPARVKVAPTRVGATLSVATPVVLGPMMNLPVPLLCIIIPSTLLIRENTGCIMRPFILCRITWSRAPSLSANLQIGNNDRPTVLAETIALLGRNFPTLPTWSLSRAPKVQTLSFYPKQMLTM